jgi:DNA-binding NarL/FixJ family response regulator
MRVLICDDHPVYRRGLRALLGELDDVDVVGEAATGEEAVALVDRVGPDVVMMDLHLPGVNGVEATRRILSRHPGVGVLVLTMFDDDRYVASALRAGARGYLVKGADHDEIHRALTSVARGEVLLGQAVSSRLAAALGDPAAADAFPELTSRERDVLELAAAGLSNQQIAARLFLSPKTVRNNVSAILAKLGSVTRAEAIARARDAGVGDTR